MNRQWNRHRWINRWQTLLLLVLLLGLLGGVGLLLSGRLGAGVMLAFGAAAVLLEPVASGHLTLRRYSARPIDPVAAPELYQMLHVLAERANLRTVPRLYRAPGAQANAFAVGTDRASAIVLSDGLLHRLDFRQLFGVLAHEVAHIAHGDLRVMGLADTLGRLTHFGSLVGLVLLLLTLPMFVVGIVSFDPLALLLLLLAPQAALLAQLGLSRVREFDADLSAARLTGDPAGLALALGRIDSAHRGWRSLLLPGTGQPEPSWLRTHPPTGERIRRLLELAPPTTPPDFGLRRPAVSPRYTRTPIPWFIRRVGI